MSLLHRKWSYEKTTLQLSGNLICEFHTTFFKHVGMWYDKEKRTTRTVPFNSAPVFGYPETGMLYFKYDWPRYSRKTGSNNLPTSDHEISHVILTLLLMTFFLLLHIWI